MTRRVQVALPEAPWVAVPRSGDPAAWAEQEAAGITADPQEAAALAAELSVIGRQVQERESLACAALVPEQVPPSVLAVLLVEQVDCGPDLAAVTAELADDGTAHLHEPEVTEVALPLGPAVRRHALVTMPDGGVVEGVEHVVPLGDGIGLRIDLSWAALALGEELVGLADAAARGVGLTDD